MVDIIRSHKFQEGIIFDTDVFSLGNENEMIFDGVGVLSGRKYNLYGKKGAYLGSFALYDIRRKAE